MGVTINEAQLVEKVTGKEKIPVSDGSGLPKAITAEQMKDYIAENITVDNGIYLLELMSFNADKFIELKKAVENKKLIQIENPPFIVDAYDKIGQVKNVTSSSVILRFSVYNAVPQVGEKKNYNQGYVDLECKSNGTFNTSEDHFNIERIGDGTKFLSDDGTYKKVTSSGYDDTEIKAQIKENADNIAANKADADAKLSELGSEVGKVRFTSVCSVGHVDEHYTWDIASSSESFERIYGYYGIDGKFVEAGIITGKIKVKYGQLIKIVFGYEGFIENVLIVSFWKDEKLVYKVVSSNSHSSLNDTVVLEVPSGVDTVIITGAAFIYVTGRDLIKENLETSKELTKTKALFDLMDVRVGNLILISEVYYNYGIDNTGKIVNVNWGLYVVPVNPNTTYYIKCDEYQADMVGMMGYSKNPDVIFNNQMSSVNLFELPEYNGYKVFTTNGDTNYLFINKAPLQTENNVEISEYLDMEYPTTVGERGILNKINRFRDKKLAVFGDSITWLGFGGVPNRGWTTHFKEIMKFGEFINYARSGATWSNTPNTVYDIEEDLGTIGDNNVIYNQVNRLIYDIEQGSKVPDYIMFVAGCNDIWYESQRPNAMSKTAEEVFEDTATDYLSKSINECTSIAESIRYIAEMLIQKCPNTQVVICTPLQMTKGSLKVAQKIGNIIKESGEYLGWNVIDQSKECGISRLQETRGYYNTCDGVHTSEIGAKKVAGILAAKCNAIFAI